MAKKVLVTDHSAYNPTSLSYFKNLVNKGVRGAFIKLTEGSNWSSSVASQQIANAFKAGIKSVGAYHFFHGNGKSEARYFLYFVKLYGLDKTTPVMIDSETSDIGGTGNINDFIDVLYDYGYKNIYVYSMQSYFGNYIYPNQLRHGAKLWVANYSGGFSLDNVTLWQYTDNFEGTGTDASICYFPDELGIEESARKVQPKVKPHYYLHGNHFHARGQVKQYKDIHLKQQTGVIRDHKYLIHGSIVLDGEYPRIKTPEGNYYTASVAFVKRVD